MKSNLGLWLWSWRDHLRAQEISAVRSGKKRGGNVRNFEEEEQRGWVGLLLLLLIN